MATGGLPAYPPRMGGKYPFSICVYFVYFCVVLHTGTYYVGV